MTASSVVLTSGCPRDIVEVLSEERGAAIALAPLDDDDTWVARTALAITAQIDHGHAHPPLLLVLAGSTARHAPALGFAQRAARRSVVGYVLIDPEFPRAGQVSDWPDAPVTVVLTDDEDPRARDARLRGWEIAFGDPARCVAEIARRP